MKKAKELIRKAKSEKGNIEMNDYSVLEKAAEKALETMVTEGEFTTIISVDDISEGALVNFVENIRKEQDIRTCLVQQVNEYGETTSTKLRLSVGHLA